MFLSDVSHGTLQMFLLDGPDCCKRGMLTLTMIARATRPERNVPSSSRDTGLFRVAKTCASQNKTTKLSGQRGRFGFQ